MGETGKEGEGVEERAGKREDGVVGTHFGPKKGHPQGEPPPRCRHSSQHPRAARMLLETPHEDLPHQLLRQPSHWAQIRQRRELLLHKPRLLSLQLVNGTSRLAYYLGERLLRCGDFRGQRLYRGPVGLQSPFGTG